MTNDRDGSADLRLYKPREAADFLGVSYDWLLLQAREGKIPHRRYGRRLIRFAHEDLVAFKCAGFVPVRDDARRSA